MTTNDDDIAIETESVDAIDQIGRRVGAELRHPAPPGALDATIRTAKARSTARAVVIGAVSIVLVAGVIAVTTRSKDSAPATGSTVPVRTSPSAAPSTAVVSTAATSTTAAATNGTVIASTTYDGSLGEIIFMARGEDHGDNQNVYTADIDGSSVQTIATGWDRLELSPDGTQLVGSRNTSAGVRRPFIVDVGGANEREVPIADADLSMGEPSWSPDGSHIVAEGFSGTAPGKSGIYTFATDGTDLVKLTDPGQHEDVGAQWSPDGSRVLFSRTAEVGDNTDRVQLMVVNADGTDAHLVGSTDYITQSGTWSPDGSKIAVVQARGDGTFFENTFRAVFVADAAGGEAAQVTDWKNIWDVAWSPDGTQFALTMYAPRIAGATIGDFQIHVMNVDGTGVRQLVTSEDHTTFSTTPEWSSDGRTILYFQAGGEPFQKSIWQVDVATANSTIVLQPEADGFDARWVKAG